MEQIKQIENTIKTLVEDNKDLIDLDKALREKLKNQRTDTSDINDKKVKLFNYLLKHSKKKILFKMTIKTPDSYEKERDIEVGLNLNGLGLINKYERNLKNIDEYYVKEQFLKLLDNKEFCENLKENIPTKNKPKLPIIKKIMAIKNKVDDNNLIIINANGEIIIKINSNNDLSYCYKEDSYGKRLRILNIDFEKNDDDDYKKLISNFKLDVNIDDLKQFAYLVKYKDSIMPILQEQIKKIEATEQDIKNKLKVLDSELKPFEALESL